MAERLRQRPVEYRLIAAQATGMPMGVVAFQRLPLFALRIGASVAQLGQLFALIWITDILQFLISGEVQRHRKQRWMRAAYWVAFLATLGYLLVPWLSERSSVGVVVVVLLTVVIVYNAALALAIAAWSPYV